MMIRLQGASKNSYFVIPAKAFVDRVMSIAKFILSAIVRTPPIVG